MTRHLLIVSPTDSRGGAEGYMVTIASEAAATGWQVTIGLEDSPGTSTLVRELKHRPDLRYVDASLRKRAQTLDNVRQLAVITKLLARARPTVMMIVLPWPNLGIGCMLAPALLGIPTVVVFQLAPWPVRIGPRRAALCKWAQGRHQQWVAVSDQNRLAIAKTFGVLEETLRTIYNGTMRVSSPDTATATALGKSLREELHLPQGTRIILTVGRLHVQKGYTDLLQILPKVLATRPDLVFVWAGEGELRSELESLIVARRLQQGVRLLGFRSDIAALLCESDLFLLPSRFEGSPFGLLEALSHGTPTLASDAGGAPEIVRAGIDGLIHRRGDPQDLLRQLEWALDHPVEMRAMAVSGANRVSQFSETSMLSETFAIIDDLARH